MRKLQCVTVLIAATCLCVSCNTAGPGGGQSAASQQETIGNVDNTDVGETTQSAETTAASDKS